MARTKVKLQFITNSAVRRSTLKRRQRNLLKKVNEISILCGVDACCIIYDPEDADNPQVWPQPEDARRTLMTFYDLPENERRRKMTNHLEFVQARVAALKKKIAKLDSENDKLEVRAILYESIEGNGFVGLTGRYLRGVTEALDELIAKVYKRISTMRPPPEARDEEATDDAGTKTGAFVKPAVAPAGATSTAIASAEAGPSSRAKGGSEFSVEGSGNIHESSDDDSDHLSDSEEEDDDDGDNNE